MKHNGNLIERAAARVRNSYLERSRTYRIYKQHVKDAKDVKELSGDVLFEQIRSDMQLAKENHITAQQAYEAVIVCPPL